MEHAHNGNQMLDPYLLFEKAHLQPGMHAADFGCGSTGHIVFPAAKIIGEHGIMYGVDIMKSAIQAIHKRAELNKMMNVQTIWSDIELDGKTAIPAKSLDVAFLVNTMVQAKDPNAMLKEIHRLLKDKARLIIVDWVKKGLRFGPSDDRFINFEDIKKWGRDNGFVVQEEFPVGQYHSGLVFYKNK